MQKFEIINNGVKEGVFEGKDRWDAFVNFIRWLEDHEHVGEYIHEYGPPSIIPVDEDDS